MLTTTGADGRQNVEQFAYATDNTLAGVIVNDQAVAASAFDTSFSPTLVSDGEGHTTQTSFSAAGLPTAQTNALGQTSQITYDAHNRPLLITDTLGIATEYAYDDRGNLIRQTSGITSSSALRATTLYTYSYDVRYSGDSLLVEQRSVDGVVTHYDYPSSGSITAHGQVSQVTVGYGTPLAQTTAYTYDSLGRVTETTVGVGTALARTDKTVYNADNTVAKTIQNYTGSGVFSPAHPDQNITTSYGYDPLGRTILVTDTLGHRDATHYNAAGQVDWTIRNLTPLQYDGQGQPLFQSYGPSRADANVATLYGYDGLGRTVLVTQTGILSGSFNTSTLQFSSATQRVTRTEYDDLSRPITVTLNYQPSVAASAESNVQTVTYYDGASNPIWQRDALGRWTKTEYDALNRPVKTILNYEDGDPLTGARDADLVSVTSYDVGGRVERTIDNHVNGAFTSTEPIIDRITLYQYDTLGRTTTTTRNYAPGVTGNDLNRTSTSAYDAVTTRMIGQQDALGRWVSEQYDLLGRVTTTIQNCRNGLGTAIAQGCAAFSSSTPDRNVTIETHYDALGRAFESIDVLGHVNHTAYDGLGRSIATTQNYVLGGAVNADTNVTTRTTYDALGRTTIVTDALGYATRSNYTDLGQTVLVTDTLGRVSRMGYDGTGTPRWVKRSDGQLMVYQVDGMGRMVATIANYQDGLVAGNEPADQDLISSTIYDTAGRRTQTTDAAGRMTLFDYDNQDRLIQVTENAVSGSCTNAPCNVVTQYQYDRTGNRTAIIDANGHTRRFSYDAADQPASATDPLNHTTSWDYDQGGRVTVQHDPRGSSNDLTYSYDGLNRRTQTAATNLGTITAAYDALGRRTNLGDSTGTTSFQYDALGRITQVQAPNTGTVGYAYDARGQRTQLTYPDSTTLDYGYWADGQLRVVTGTTTLASYEYDSAGRLVQVSQANGAVKNYAYDRADRFREVQTSVAGTVVGGVSYQTDRVGLRTVITDTLPLSPTISTTRLKTITFEGASLTDSTTGADQTTGFTPTLDGMTPLKGAYSALIIEDTGIVEEFDPVDEVYYSFYVRVSLLPSASTELTEIFSTARVPMTSVWLQSDGSLQLEQYGTVVSGSSSALTPGALYRIGIHQKFNGSGLESEAYLADGDDAFGSSFASVTGAWSRDQATKIFLGPTFTAEATVDDIAIDTGSMPVASNPVPTRVITYTYDGLQRLTEAHETPGQVYTYTYDLAGNRTAVTVNGTTTTTSYNAANQVSGWTYDNAGNLTNDGTASYSYDALSRLTIRGTTTYTYNGDGVLVFDGATRYTQDLVSPLSQILQTTQGSTTSDYLYGSERLASVTTGIRTWYGSDALGSVRQTLSDVGAPLSVVNYDPWGTVESGSVPTFGFTGELQDSATGLVNLRARWYSTANGTFTAHRWRTTESDDTIPYTHHGYAYALSNPVLWTDPAGTCPMQDDQDCHKPPQYPDPRRPVVCPVGWSWGGPSQPECLRNSDYTNFTSVTNPYISIVKEAARTYGVPWQVVAGVLAAELTLDTDFYHRAQDALFRGSPNVGFWIFGHDAGYGLGNIHFPTALTVGYYLQQCYGIQLPGYTSTPWMLARMLSHDDVNIQYIAGIVRYLADYRFGAGGKPSKTSHADIADWVIADGAAVWHAYRYGINQELSPPYGKGFASVEDFQNRDPDIQGLLDRIQPQENAARKSVADSVPIFKYYFAQR